MFNVYFGLSEVNDILSLKIKIFILSLLGLWLRSSVKIKIFKNYRSALISLFNIAKKRRRKEYCFGITFNTKQDPILHYNQHIQFKPMT